VAGPAAGNAAGTVIGSRRDRPLGPGRSTYPDQRRLLNPSNTGGNSTGFWCTPPKQISVTSPLGGTATRTSP